MKLVFRTPNCPWSDEDLPAKPVGAAQADPFLRVPSGQQRWIRGCLGNSTAGTPQCQAEEDCEGNEGGKTCLQQS